MTKIFVKNENTMIYHNEYMGNLYGVLASKPDGDNPVNGPISLTIGDQVRKATAHDFDYFRVEMTGYQI